MVQTGKTKRIFDGRFEIVGIVGRGSQSVVYHARNALSPESHVALKVLVNHSKSQSAAQLGEKLRKEALAMVAARHRYVVRIEDFHSIDSLCYLSMEFAPEGDLRRYIQSRLGKLPPAQADRFFKQALEALCAVHKSGIIHRDIKPDNILVLNDREIRLADFGTAVLPGDESSITELQKGVGTFAYMAPEVLDGIEYREAADLYSLGVTFYELLSGKHPFDNVPLMDQLKVRADKNIKPIGSIVSDVSPNLSHAIMKCLAFKKEDRPSSAEELLESLSGLDSAPLATKVEVINEKPKLSPKVTPPAAMKLQPSSTRPEPQRMSTTLSGSTAAPKTERISLHPKPTAPQPPPSQMQSKPAEPGQSTPHIPKAPLEPAFDIKLQTGEFLTQTQKPFVQSQQKQDLLAVRRDPPQAAPHRMEARAETIERPPVVEQEVRDAIRDIIAGKTQKSRGSAISIPAHKRIPGAFFIVILMALAIYVRFFAFNGSEEADVSPKARLTTEDIFEEPSVGQPSTQEPLVPKPEHSKITFPNLPSGMYHGEINGLYPGTKHSLTFISFGKRQRLAIIVGLEGWRPIVISTEGLKDGAPVKISANGFVLQLTGKHLDDGEIVGFFKNMVVGGQGEWRIKHLESKTLE